MRELRLGEVGKYPGQNLNAGQPGSGTCEPHPCAPNHAPRPWDIRDQLTVPLGSLCADCTCAKCPMNTWASGTWSLEGESPTSPAAAEGAA